MIGIYKIENLVNGKIYIGQSTCIEERWSKHKSYAINQYPSDKGRYNQHLYSSMRKYGIENFSFEVLEETTIDKLDEREIYWIDYYNSYEEGYNNTRGGEEGRRISQKEIEEICRLWKNGYSVSQIVEKVNYKRFTVLKYLNTLESTYSAGEGYKRGEERRYNLFLEKNEQKQVDSFDLYNNYLGSFYLIRHASEYYSIDISAIRLCCDGKRYSVGGYRFSYHKQPLVFTQKRHSTTPLYKIDTNDSNKITYYSSITEAAEDNKCCRETILKRIKDGKKTLKGLYWKYVKENYTPDIKDYFFIDKKQKQLEVEERFKD